MTPGAKVKWTDGDTWYCGTVDLVLKQGFNAAPVTLPVNCGGKRVTVSARNVEAM